jgi:formylglycine-generating enzyme required for sulfatase activity
VYELLSGAHPFPDATAVDAFTDNLVPAPIGKLTLAQNGALLHALQLQRKNRTASINEFESEFWAREKPPLLRRALIPLAVVAALATLAILLAVFKGRFGTHMPDKAPPREVPPAVSGLALATFLGMPTNSFQAGSQHSPAEILSLVATSVRRVQLGSTESEIEAALALCRQYSQKCDRSWFDDENYRQATLHPFVIDSSAVTVGAFRTFVTETNYRTQAQLAGGAFALRDGQQRWVPGGSWMNAVGAGAAPDETAVVGVSFVDAERFCSWRGFRLPTEDEWEYVARGPQRYTFPWGSDLAPARRHIASRPAASEGLAQGIGGNYRGLSGNVWEWVDTQGQGGEGRRVLKGGSWLEENPANRRSASRRSEVILRADEDSGFRCARTVDNWPDAEFWSRNWH